MKPAPAAAVTLAAARATPRNTRMSMLLPLMQTVIDSRAANPAMAV
jgi:hypothetical protein